MKIKLLKKVRKRFQIYRIDELSSSPTVTELECVSDWGLPFYEILDLKDDYRNLYCQNNETALSNIRKWIRDDYYEKFKHKPEKKVNVWWTKQITN